MNALRNTRCLLVIVVLDLVFIDITGGTNSDDIDVSIMTILIIIPDSNNTRHYQFQKPYLFVVLLIVFKYYYYY